MNDHSLHAPIVRLGNGAVALAAIAGHVEEEIAGIKKMPLQDVLRYWHLLSDAYEALDKERKRVYAAVENLSRGTIPEMMQEQGVRSMTLDDLGYRFTVSQRFSCSMPDKDAGMKWLRENGLGDLIQETVNSGTLSSAMKRLIENEGREPPADYFNTNYMSYTSATKAK
jgi:hypothetical protein